jgi:periplasmic protein TonB
MFEESLLESAHLIRTQSRWPAFASFGLQAAIAATIIIVPILHPEVVPLHTKLLEITAPPLPTQPPPPPKRVHVDMSESTSTSVPEPAQPTMAAQIDTRLDPNRSSNDPPPDGASIGAMSNSSNPLASLAPSGTTGGANVVVAGPVRPVVAHISTGVSAGLLLAPIQPIYPAIAKAAHQEGIVTVHAIISKTGTIESASATSGPMMLQQAALEAIRRARYRPYLLNGLPTEVDTIFVVNFRLSGS